MKNIDIEVSIDVTEYVEDILEQADDKDLIGELAARGYSVSAGCVPQFNPGNAADCKRFFCSLMGLSYFVSDKELLNEIKKVLK